MLRYSFAPRTKTEISEASKANAVMLTSVDEILDAHESKAYKFLTDDALTKDFTERLRKATEINVQIDYTTNGTKVNKVTAIEPDGKVRNLSVYGAKKEVKPAGKYDNATAKKCIFGVCKSAGEYVGDYVMKNGVLSFAPTVYIVFPEDIANLDS